MIRCFNGATTVALLLLTGFACTAERAPPAGPLHLIIDAGSSGSRLCLFSVTQTCENGACVCRAPPAGPAESGECRAVAAEGGLAALAPERALAVLRSAVGGLSDETRARIRGAALLGTGGFRALPADERAARTAALAAALAAEIPAARVKIISGEEEGRLAWYAVRERQRSQAHSILETGGASVQFASGADDRARIARTAPCGMNVTFDRLRLRSDFHACYPAPASDDAAPRPPTRFDACYALLAPELASARCRLSNESERRRGAPLYGLGAPWNKVFALAGSDTVDAARLQALGREICENLKPDAENEFERRACYLIAFQTALLAAVQGDVIQRGGESWPRGAAVSADYFDVCRNPNP